MDEINNMNESIRISVNGEVRSVSPSTNIGGLLRLLGLEGQAVAVERNGSVVPKAGHGDTLLANDDVLEVVHFVGGG